MTITYRLKIECESLEKLQEVMGLSPESTFADTWSASLNDHDDGEPMTFIDRLLAHLQGKEEQLAEIGVHADNITLWVYYAYDEQCNLEFGAADLGRLARRGIPLCVSCWRQ